MAKETPGRDTERDESEKKWELKKEEYSQFIGKDLIQTYIFLRNCIPKDVSEKFEIRQNLIEIGKELLPSIDEIENKKDKEEIPKLYKEATETIEKQPSPGNRIYDFLDIGGKRVTVYQFTSDEIKGNKWTCLETEYIKASENFDKEQCKKYIPELVTTDNKIFKYLIKYNIIKKEDKSSDELLEDWVKEEIKNAKSKLIKSSNNGDKK